MAPSFIERRAEGYLGSRVERALAARFDLEPAAAVELAEALRLSPERAKQVVVVRKDALVRESDRDGPMFREAQRSYALALDRLLKELRILGAVHCLMFALAALLLMIARGSQRVQPLPGLGGGIAIATAVAGVVFLFARDWTWSVLTGDSLGTVYFLTMVLIALTALDVGLNDARVTSLVARVLWWWPP